MNQAAAEKSRRTLSMVVIIDALGWEELKGRKFLEYEEANLEACKQAIVNEDIDFAYLYKASKDSLLHEVGKDSEKEDEKLRWYEQVRSLL